MDAVIGFFADILIWIIDEPWRIVIAIIVSIAVVFVLSSLAIQDIENGRRSKQAQREWKRSRSMRSEDI